VSDLGQLLQFLCRLEKHTLHYRLEHNSDEALMVLVAVPGERWEIEFFEDGAIEIERFGSSAGISSGAKALAKLQQLFEVFGGE